MKRILFTLVVCCFSQSLIAAPELKGSPNELSAYLLDTRKIISINGEADVKVEADQAIVALTIKNEARSLDAALQDNERLQDQVNKVLLDGGIAANKIKAANFSSTPDYGWLKDKPKSYEISREIKVTVANAAQMRTIAKVVDNIDEVFMGAMSFEDSAKIANELKAVEKALANILAKKALYEKTFSVSLNLVRVMDHGVRPIYRAVRRDMRPKEQAFSSAMMSDSGMESSSHSAPFAGITYHANAVAEFVVIK